MVALNAAPNQDSRFFTRSYQRDFAGAFARHEYDRFLKVWHRQGGKDDCAFNVVGQDLVLQDAAGTIGNYGYIFPEFEHAKRGVWDKVCGHNIRMIEHIPEAARAGRNWLNEASMQLWLRNGTSLQFFGARFPDKLRGMSLKGVEVSEAARCNPGMLDVITPMLEVNGGWLSLNTTPNGKNWLYRLWLRALKDPRWWTQLLTCLQTIRDARGEPRFGQRIVGDAELAHERARGMTEEWIAQEYFCDWNAPMDGSILARYMNRARAEGRIGSVPWEPTLRVYTMWDLGQTAVWFVQVTGREVLVIDYEFSSETFQEIVPKLFQGPRARYVYAQHFFPPDMAVRDWTAQDGRTRIDTARALLGERNCILGNNPKIDDRINAAQWMIDHGRFDETKCAKGIEALESYRRVYDERRQDFKPDPDKDWASHGADALGEGGLHLKLEMPRPNRPAPSAVLEYRPAGTGGGGIWQH